MCPKYCTHPSLLVLLLAARTGTKKPGWHRCTAKSCASAAVKIYALCFPSHPCDRWLVGRGGSDLSADSLTKPCLHYKTAGNIEITTSDGPLHLRRCVTGPSDVIYVPDRWAHATCGLSSFNIGVGFIGSVSLLPPLHQASVDGDLQEALKSLQSKASALQLGGRGMLNENGLLPLHWAAWNGHLPLVALLLRAQEEAEVAEGIDEKGFGAAHALRWAAARGHARVTAFLARRAGQAADEQGSDILIPKFSMLCCTCAGLRSRNHAAPLGSGNGAHLGVAAAARAEGKYIEATSNQVLWLCLVAAAPRLKDAAAMQHLSLTVANVGECVLSFQADPNTPDAYGARPVQQLCIERGKGAQGVVQMLLACGSFLKSSRALRHFLAGEGHVPVLRLLLLSGSFGDGSMNEAVSS